MAAQITSPLELFLDSDGTPLEDGYIYIGTQGLNAETNPITVYWDDAYSIAASQPIRTIAGYGSNGGVKSNIFVNSSYSIVIKDKNGVLVFSGDSLTDPEVAVGVADAQLKVWEAEAEALTSESYATEPEDTFVNVFTSDGDGTFTATPTTDYSALHWAAKASTYVPTAGTWTPTTTSVANVTSSTAALGMYSRVGSVVTCTVTITVTPTASSTLTSVSFTIPIPSLLSAADGTELVGMAISDQADNIGLISANTAADEAYLSFTPATSGAGITYVCQFQYRIIT